MIQQWYVWYSWLTELGRSLYQQAAHVPLYFCPWGLRLRQSQRTGPHFKNLPGLWTVGCSQDSRSLLSQISRLRGSSQPWTLSPTGYLFPSSGDFPNEGIKPGSSALQTNSLPAELQAYFHIF